MNNRYYLFPTLTAKGSLNPYLDDFCNALSKKVDVINKSKRANSAVIDLLKCCFSADTYIFNWIEDVPFRRMGKIQTLVFIFIIFPILKFRKAKLYWIFHNFSAHKGRNFLSTILRKMMMKYSNVIITHSKEALNYLEKNANPRTKKLFANHPVKNRIITNSISDKLYDILIWGAIEPYKGIADFMQFLNTRGTTFKVKIVGKCNDKLYRDKINSLTSKNITYENKIIPFEELGELISKSRFIVFPYLKQSISSSGALMDTISFGGTAIGPDKGAFNDLADEGICYTFSSYNDIIDIINDRSTISIDIIENFILKNTWAKFSEKIINL